MINLLKKELNYYLNNPIGYITVILFALFANFLFIKDIFLYGSSSLRPFFNLMPWLLIIFIPAISMRILAEEKRSNTIEILMTLPYSETQLVLAKLAALIILVLISLVLTFAFPLSLAFYNSIYLPEAVIGYSGIILMASAFTAVALYVSSRTKNQVVAFLISAIILFLSLVAGSDFLATVLPKIIIDGLNYLSPVYHLQNFVKGVIDLRSVYYFVSLIGVMAVVTIVELEKKS